MNLRINGERLWQSLMDMAKIGATEKGGVCRLALTDLDRESRDLFIEWCKEAGCDITVDTVGNIYARRPGTDPDAKPVMTGSHLDSQPTGGKFDGVYGVLAGLEVIRTLNDHNIETTAPVEAVVWTNEEGSRFAPAMVASGVFADVFDAAYAYEQKSDEGETFGGELERIGYKGEVEPSSMHGAAYFEAHIEQGPILENEEKTVGVVTGVQGIRWYDISVVGDEAHAGPTPMPLRRDAFMAAADLALAARAIALENAPHGRATVGKIAAMPGSRNVIPGQAAMTLDLRHPDPDVSDAMDTALRARAAEIAKDHHVDIDVEEIWYSPPVAFDDGCVSAVREGAGICGYEHMDIVSGAGHDAVYVSKVQPTGMIFVPCENGISHNEVENATPEDIEAGCNVLLHAMMRHAM